MKAYFDDNIKTLVIEAETNTEGVALNAWFDKYIQPLERGTIELTIKPVPKKTNIK